MFICKDLYIRLFETVPTFIRTPARYLEASHQERNSNNQQMAQKNKLVRSNWGCLSVPMGVPNVPQRYRQQSPNFQGTPGLNSCMYIRIQQLSGSQIAGVSVDNSWLQGSGCYFLMRSDGSDIWIYVFVSLNVANCICTYKQSRMHASFCILHCIFTVYCITVYFQNPAIHDVHLVDYAKLHA